MTTENKRLLDQSGKARFPYMPFFVDDWLSSDAVAQFTLEQQAAYINLLLRQWKAEDGILPNNRATLARWSGLGDRWGKLGPPIIRACFVERHGGLVNPKCRKLWEWTRDKSAQARAAVMIRHGKNGKR